VSHLVSGLLGSPSGPGPQAAPIVSPVTKEQAQSSYEANQQALAQQQQFLQAVQAQNGLANQSNVFNQLQNVASGQGPNPAQAMLNQATGANVANQAALMAGQRGAGANVGLIGRQAAMQGAGIQQQAAGQGATMQANQSLGALGQMGGIAGQQAAQLAGATSANTAAQQQEQQNLLNSIAGVNQAQVANQSSINAANAQAQAAQMGMVGNVISGISGGVGAAMQKAEGGIIQKYADGAMVQAAPQQAMPNTNSNYLVDYFNENPKSMAQIPAAQQPTMAQGGKVPALVSPGEKYLPPAKVEAVKQGANPMAIGKTIPGKPKVGGAVNSYTNDTVKANLDEGGIVIPRSVTQGKNPEKKAMDFVRAVLAKQGKGLK